MVCSFLLLNSVLLHGCLQGWFLSLVLRIQGPWRWGWHYLDGWLITSVCSRSGSGNEGMSAQVAITLLSSKWADMTKKIDMIGLGKVLSFCLILGVVPKRYSDGRGSPQKCLSWESKGSVVMKFVKEHVRQLHKWRWMQPSKARPQISQSYSSFMLEG